MSSSTVIRPSKTSKQFPWLSSGIYTVALGNMTSFEIVLYRQDNGLMLGVMGVGCYYISSYADARYVKEKLRVSDGDAGNLADFINDQLKIADSGRQGNYNYPDLLA